MSTSLRSLINLRVAALLAAVAIAATACGTKEPSGDTDAADTDVAA